MFQEVLEWKERFVRGADAGRPNREGDAALLYSDPWRYLSPVQGSGKANPQAALDVAVAFCSYSGAHFCLGSKPGCYALIGIGVSMLPCRSVTAGISTIRVRRLSMSSGSIRMISAMELPKYCVERTGTNRSGTPIGKPFVRKSMEARRAIAKKWGMIYRD